MNLIEAAITDLGVASALLRNKRSGVTGLDVRELAGGAAALATGPRAFDVYTGAIDAGLRRMRGLKNRGYILCRAEITHVTPR